MILSLVVAAALLQPRPKPEPVRVDHDTIGCVTIPESRHAGGRQTRDSLEIRWGVSNLGERVFLPIFGVNAWIYPLCGFDTMDSAFAYATFDHRRLDSSGLIDQGH